MSSLSFADLVEALRGAGETTRLRILALLDEAELTVTDLTDILRQSQPVVSRHLKVLVDAGIVTRFREGSWAFFRLSYSSRTGVLVRTIVRELDAADQVLVRDRERLQAVRAGRSLAAKAYFDEHAVEWDELRQLHVADDRVEQVIVQALGPEPIPLLLDLGTGTGRMLELLGKTVGRGMGVDLSHEMLTVARANIARAGLRHCTVQQGDLLDLPFPVDTFDVVIVHQVLHLLDQPEVALAEAARVLKPGGRLLVVDFAPHDQESLRQDHAHRRLGFATDTVSMLMRSVGLEVSVERTILPDRTARGRIAVSLWLGRDVRASAGAAAILSNLRGVAS
jgi:ubiquinone/menaquinone biosynthesis C-methylase UbiE/DNA-binding transcriptional ArsR family regulator